jgi:tRNA-specific 2-thiouridylase
LIAAVSGGVDSAVAAARMVEAGHAVTAVYFHFFSRLPDTGRPPDDRDDARLVADHLGLPFEVWDLADHFERQVVDYFAAEYAAGRTPNPCLRCNRTVKFGAVIERALAAGFDGVVTGHYARLMRPEPTVAGSLATTPVSLRRAVDFAKDQSYVVASLPPELLRRAFFPLGEMTKSAVRAEAAERGLPVASKPDSTDVCFIPDGDTAGWLRSRLGERPGPIVTSEREIVGAHRGTTGFTIGQRRGLRLGQPAADGQPRYVVGLEPATATVVVGSRQELRVDRIRARQPVWTSGQPPTGRVTGQVQLRAHGQPLPATLEWSEPVADGARVGVLTTVDDSPALSLGESGKTPYESAEVVINLATPAFGVAPGQTAVFYDGDEVVGSAVIEATAVNAVCD